MILLSAPASKKGSRIRAFAWITRKPNGCGKSSIALILWIARTIARVAVAATVMAAAMAFARARLDGPNANPLAELVVVGGVGLSAYLGASLLLRERAFAYLPAAIFRARRV